MEGEEAGAVGSLEVKLLGKLRGLEHALTMSRLQEAQSAGPFAECTGRAVNPGSVLDPSDSVISEVRLSVSLCMRASHNHTYCADGNYIYLICCLGHCLVPLSASCMDAKPEGHTESHVNICLGDGPSEI